MRNNNTVNFPFSFLSYIYQEVGVKESYNSEPPTDVKKKLKTRKVCSFWTKDKEKDSNRLSGEPL